MTTTTLVGLRDRFDGALFEPGGEGFDEARRVWNAAIDVRPRLVARPNGRRDVQEAVRWARENGVPLAVRGGGHSVNGWGLRDDGLALDLSALRTVAVDPAAGVVRAGGAATWGALDLVTFRAGLATPGGSVSTTGVAGVTLGGGFGHLLRRHGLGVDNLRAVDLVTADGDAVRVDAERDPELLWPDTPESQARTNVRKVLLLLRRAVPEAEEFLDVTGSTLQWRAATAWRVDVAELDASLAAARAAAADGAMARHLSDAVERYRDDLLPGCHDEWVEPIRLSYARRHREALRELVALHAARGELAAAVTAAERLLAHDPLDEQAAQQLVRLHDARGDRARAVRVYHGLAAALHQELGLEPSPTTRRLYDGLLARDDDEAPPASVRRAPYVGRQLERKTLAAAWRTAEAGWASAVLVLGEAGAGKSRLVEDFARWCAHRRVATAYSRSYAAEGAPAYAPVVPWLRSPAVRRGVDRLAAPVRAALAPLLPELLCDASVRDVPTPSASESDRRQRLWEAVVAALTSRGSRCCSSPTTCTGPTTRPRGCSTTSCGPAVRPRCSSSPLPARRSSTSGRPCSTSCGGCGPWTGSRRCA